jgi:hypothetical protein
VQIQQQPKNGIKVRNKNNKVVKIMSTYKEIAGTNIEVLSSDPANPVEGQVWYNSTSNTVKANFINPGSWATGGALNTARS